MREIAAEAMRAGAVGFATSRSVFHLDKFGRPVPTKDSVEPEIEAIGEGMRMAGHGVIEALIDYDDIDAEFGILRDVSKRNGLALTFTIAQLLDKPHGWKRSLQLVEQANNDGVNVKGQVIGRPTGLLLGLELSYNPFSLYPAYQEIAGLPLEERIAQMRRPEVRERIINDKAAGAKLKLLDYIQAFQRTYLLGDPPDYAPPPEASIAAIAERQGISPLEVAYDMLLQDGGQAILFVTVGNYADGNLDAVTQLLTDKNTIMGLGDGGAHYGIISDAAYPTFMLTFWCRDKDGLRLALPEVIAGLTKVPAEFIGFRDRGQLAPGYKADINIIDLDRLHLHAPQPVFDLPSGGRRLIQRADGYVATFVDGEMTYSEGQATGALPGKLVRGPQAAPGHEAAVAEPMSV
jgi:N-acyl-D-aspartate/D-glutamate deacylase